MIKIPLYYFAAFFLLTGCNLQGSSPILRVTKSMLHGGPATTDQEFYTAFSDDALAKMTPDAREIFSVARRLLEDPRPTSDPRENG